MDKKDKQKMLAKMKKRSLYYRPTLWLLEADHAHGVENTYFDCPLFLCRQFSRDIIVDE